MRRKAKYQDEMQDEYAKIKNRLKNMDIELHTEGPDWSNVSAFWGPILTYTKVNYHVVDNSTAIKSQDTISLKVFQKPFATGGCRLAYYAQDSMGSKYVAKTSMRQGTNLARTIAEMEADVNAHMMARQYADDFNKALAKTGLATQTVTYHPVNLVLLEAGRSAPGPQTAMFLEPFLTGRFVKWQSNDGEVKHVEATLQAFSHFSNMHMRSQPIPEQGVVVDIQGIQCGNTFTLTDPAIHCTSDKRRFGDTNMGEQGINSFFVSHSCNTLCSKMGLV